MKSKQLAKVLNRRRCYKSIFLDPNDKPNPNAEVVLADLKRFCRAQHSTAVISPVSKTIDPLAMAMAEGRREVWNRIMAYLHIDDRTITNLRDPYEDQRSDYQE